jgi:hypothetical protein
MVKNFLAGLVAAVWLLGMFVLAFAVPRLEYEPDKYMNKEFPEPLSSSDPALVEDQMRVREISKVARSLPGEFNKLIKDYEKIAPLPSVPTGRITEADYAIYQMAFDIYTKEMNNFQRNVKSKNPGVFQTFAIVGMIAMFNQVVSTRAMVAAGVTEEDFTWLMMRIEEGAAYCVDYNLKNKQLADEQKKRQEFLLDMLFRHINVIETTPDGNLVHHPERWRPETIPRQNLQVFLNHHKTFRFFNIDFEGVECDVQGIMTQAANNPP